MTFHDFITTEFWGIELWVWLLIILGIVGLIMVIRTAMAKKKESAIVNENTSDPEAGNIVSAKLSPPKSPTNEFLRDAPLPPPAPSETSEKGKP